MAQKTVPVNVTPETKTRIQKALREHFLPGSAEWAFVDALLQSALSGFERGELEIGGTGPRGGSRPKPRNRPDRPRHAPLSAPEGAAGGVGAFAHSNGSESHGG